MSAQHTPGPWEVVDVPHTGLIGVRRGKVVLNFEAKFEADAQLIAAAPELLEQAQHVLMLIDQAVDNFPQSELVGLRAAIAKATGSA